MFCTHKSTFSPLMSIRANVTCQIGDSNPVTPWLSMRYPRNLVRKASALVLSLSMLWTVSTTSSSQGSKLKALQMSPTIRPPHDPKKQGTRANPSCDQDSHDQAGNKSPDISCAPTCDKSRDLICFG
jgi:hypothetical protein